MHEIEEFSYRNDDDMNTEHELSEQNHVLQIRILKAQQDNVEMERLLQDYMPFIKKQSMGEHTTWLEYEDCQSIAMLTFVSCVRQYDPGKGTFIGYAARAIRNRLIDENKKETNYRFHIQEDRIFDEEESEQLENQGAIEAFQIEKERENLAEEITAMTEDLKKFDITVTELAKIAPKQKRAREQCIELICQLKNTPKLWKALWENKRLPQAELARISGVSVKTIEKHRKYLITLAVVMNGHYPAVKAFFIDTYQEKEKKHPWNFLKRRKEGEA